jgi:hypothetical protein
VVAPSFFANGERNFLGTVGNMLSESGNVVSGSGCERGT